MLNNFLEFSFSNKDLNNQLTSLLKNQALSIEEKTTIEELRYISHKTTGIKDFKKIKEKFESGIDKIQKNESIPYENQITVREYGILSDFVKVKNKLKKYSDFNCVKELYEQIVEVEKMLDLFENIFLDEQKYKNGDIVMYDIKLENQFKNIKEFTKEQKGIWYFLGSKYAHAAQINISNGQAPKLSHVYGQYESDIIKFQQAMFSDVYRFDASKLLTKEGIEKAKEAFGENWEEEVNKIYQKSQQEVYETGLNSGFNNLENSSQKRLQSGKANLPFYGHKTKEEQDFKELSEKFYQRDGAEVDDNIMICSEFVTRSTISSLVKSNEELSKELGIDNALQIPFSKYEDLNKVHTQRLIDILMEKECITQVRKPKIEIMLFKEPEKAHYKTIMNMTKIVEDQLRVFEDSVIDNQLPGQKHEKFLSTFASTVRDSGVKGAISDVVKHDKVHEIIKEHDDTIKRDDSFVQKSQQSRNNIPHGRV